MRRLWGRADWMPMLGGTPPPRGIDARWEARFKRKPENAMMEASDEKAKAHELREKALAAALMLADVVADGQKHGMVVNVGQISVDQWGRPVPVMISVHKVLV